MTCRDCIHFEVCELMKQECDIALAGATHCGVFKDKAKVVELPCKVGDTVYIIKTCRCGNPKCAELKQCKRRQISTTPTIYGRVMLKRYGMRAIPKDYSELEKSYSESGTNCYTIYAKPFRMKMIEDIGKTVFLTLSEAQKKLKEMGDENSTMHF